MASECRSYCGKFLLVENIQLFHNKQFTRALRWRHRRRRAKEWWEWRVQDWGWEAVMLVSDRPQPTSESTASAQCREPVAPRWWIFVDNCDIGSDQSSGSHCHSKLFLNLQTWTNCQLPWWKIKSRGLAANSLIFGAFPAIWPPISILKDLWGLQRVSRCSFTSRSDSWWR